MNEEDRDELVTCLAKLVTMQTGKIAALQAQLDAVMGTLVRTFPPMAEVVEGNLEQLSAVLRQDLEGDSLSSFDRTIGMAALHLRDALGR